MNRHFFHRKHSDGLQTHEKMFNITKHQGYANQITIRCHLNPVRIVITKKKNKYWKACREKGTCWEYKLML